MGRMSDLSIDYEEFSTIFENPEEFLKWANDCNKDREDSEEEDSEEEE